MDGMAAGYQSSPYRVVYGGFGLKECGVGTLQYRTTAAISHNEFRRRTAAVVVG